MSNDKSNNKNEKSSSAKTKEQPAQQQKQKAGKSKQSSGGLTKQDLPEAITRQQELWAAGNGRIPIDQLTIKQSLKVNNDWVANGEEPNYEKHFKRGMVSE
ncbi:MAG: hypothetical protein ABIN67_04685 [Ferruginibacter sp.]